MADFLIHSMSEFGAIILDALATAEARTIVEIGAEFGGTSALLADYAADAGGQLTSIDPTPKREFTAWVAANPHVRHIAEPSLSALDQVADVDAWLVDGDHNWFTVYHELKQIERISRRDGRPMLVFLHDVSWPCARRDSYYAPDRIPDEYRQPFDFEGGAILGRNALLPGGGFRGMGQFAWARHEGGPRNGVLTAVEDFLVEVDAAGGAMAFAEIPAVFGLGVLFDQHAPWSEALGQQLLPWHNNALLATLEHNRLANYLRALELQDQMAAKRAA